MAAETALANRGRAGLVFIIVVLMALVGVEVVATQAGSLTNALASTTRTTTSCVYISATSYSGFGANPVTPYLSFNGSTYQGPSGFQVTQGSTSTINVTATYPWFPSMPHDLCLLLSFSIGPFPANLNGSSIPDWLNVSLSQSSVIMPYGQTASVGLRISASEAAPPGTGASFTLLVHDIDPASGEANTGVYVIGIQTETKQ